MPLFFLTFRTNIVVLEVILSQPVVLAHAKLDRLHDLLSIAELVISDQKLLQALGDGDALENLDNTLVLEQIASQVDLFQC